MKRIRAPFVLLAALILPAALSAQTIDKPVATVKLTKKEVYSARQFKIDVEKIEKAIGKTLNDETRSALIEAQVNVMLFKQFCEREKITVSEADVNKAIDQYKAQLGTGADDATLAKALQLQGVFAEPKVYIRQQLLLAAYIKARKSDIAKNVKPPTYEEVQKAYELNKKELIQPTTAKVSVLYVDIRGKSDADKKKAADRMRTMAAQLKENSAKFNEFLVSALDPASGYRSTSSQMIERTAQAQTNFGPEFIDAIFDLKAGEVSGLIENPAGYQIVRVNQLYPQKQLALEDEIVGQPELLVLDYLVSGIATKKQEAVLAKVQEELIAQLKKEGTVELFPENAKF
ncbi:MAG: peptidyl-prolyl cis-trans isomerase [Spirochaetaceae bacterium]|nr:peptidyl-prolyl cis-trans isomerase [Spirochaetaceae bacterium]